MELLFIRHAEAEDISPEGDDFHRALTPRGRQQAEILAKALPQWLTSPVDLWYSPARRTKDTASACAPGLQVRQERAHDALRRGDWEALMGDWDEQVPLVLVGHQPVLGQWIQRLSGARLGITKASVTALDWRGRHQEAPLLWHVRVEALARWRLS